MKSLFFLFFGTVFHRGLAEFYCVFSRCERLNIARSARCCRSSALVMSVSFHPHVEAMDSRGRLLRLVPEVRRDSRLRPYSHKTHVRLPRAPGRAEVCFEPF